MDESRNDIHENVSERRKDIRRKLTAFTPVYDLSNPRTLLGYIGDLTLQGALVISEKPASVNQEMSLDIAFPNDLANIKITHARLPARVAWCRRDDSPIYYNIGVEFTEVVSKHAEMFQEIMARYHFRYTLADNDFERE